MNVEMGILFSAFNKASGELLLGIFFLKQISKNVKR